MIALVSISVYIDVEDKNKIMMKLDYSTGDSDQFFSKIFHCINKACPVDVFIQLTQRRNISFILIHSREIALSIGSYTFPREVLEHTISFDSQSADDPLLSRTTLYITSNLTAGSQLVLNSFVSLRQPAVGSAMSVAYQKNGSFTSKLAEVSFSMLNTVITTPVAISSDSGLTFSTFNADVFSVYKVQVTGYSQAEDNWKNFTLNINGIFKTRPPGSFASDLEAYTHDYVENKVQEAKARLNNALSAVVHTESLMLLYNTTLEKEKANLIALNDMYLHAVNTVSQSASALNQAQNVYNSANTSVLAVLNNLYFVCEEVNCPNLCLSSLSSTSCDEVMLLNNWGMITSNELEELLKYRKSLVTEKRWNLQHICRIITKIRDWADISYGQVCSYKAVHSNVTHETGIIDTLNMTKITANIIETIDYIISQVCFKEEESCEAQILDYSCAFSNVGCHLAQGIAYDALNDTQKALVTPLIQLSNIKIQYAIENIERLNISMKINSSNAVINQTQKMLEEVKVQHEQAAKNLKSISKEVHLTLVVGRYLENNTIQQLLRLTNASFTATINSSSHSLSVPTNITCHIPLTNSYYNVSAIIDLTSALPLLKRNLASKILHSLGMQLDNATDEQQPPANLSSNRHQFESRCASLDVIKGFLTHLNQSLNLTLSKANKSKANINNAAAIITSITTSLNSVDFTQVNFTYLQDTYRSTLERDTLFTQSRDSPSFASFTFALKTLRRSILSQKEEIDKNLFLSWQASMTSLYNNRVTSLANVSCYSFPDCLVVIANALKDLVNDTPLNYIPHSLSSALIANSSLLQLSLSTNLTLSQANVITKEMNNIVDQLFQYWCSGLPIITQHPMGVVYVPQNKTLVLECTAESVQSLKYGWRKDGFTIQVSSPVLVINGITLLDEGQYQCTASNDIGLVESYLSKVYIISPPTIFLSPSNTTTFEGSDNGGWFACNASARPTPGYQWFYSKDKYNWSIVLESDSNELFVVKPILSQEGWYKCRAFIGEYESYSEAAYLTVYRASISTLNYPLHFLMVRINKNPKVTTDSIESVHDILKNDFMYNYTTNNRINMNYMNVMYGSGNRTVDVFTSFFSEFNYSLNATISCQAKDLFLYATLLRESTTNFQYELPNINFFIHDMLYVAVKSSLFVNDLQYICPPGKGVLDGNFICSEF